MAPKSAVVTSGWRWEPDARCSAPVAIGFLWIDQNTVAMEQEKCKCGREKSLMVGGKGVCHVAQPFVESRKVVPICFGSSLVKSYPHRIKCPMISFRGPYASRK